MELYSSLRVVRRKQQRTNTVKLEALEKAMETMVLADKLQVENDALEGRISELLQKAQSSKEWQEEARKKIKALQMQCRYASDLLTCNWSKFELIRSQCL